MRSTFLLGAVACDADEEVREMDAGRRKRLARLGFPEDEAQSLSRLHTRNFM